MNQVLMDFGDIKEPEASLVLDPMCGSGTTCIASAQLGRRYIGIDSSLNAIEISRERLEGTFSKPEVLTHPDAPDDWNDGYSRLVHGDTLDVLRTMPSDLVDLVYMDPPFGPGDADKRYFGITWKWTDESEHDLERLKCLSIGMVAHGRDALIAQIEAVKMVDTEMAAYLVWIVQILVECKRIMK